MKLYGFTIIDTMIGMVLSSLILVFGMGAYLNVQKEIIQWKNNRRLIERRSELQYIINLDTERSEFIYKNGDEISFHQKNQLVKYFISNNQIIRKAGHRSDTLGVRGDIYTSYNSVNNSLINHIEFKSTKGWSISFYKDYAAVPLNQKQWP